MSLSRSCLLCLFLTLSVRAEPPPAPAPPAATAKAAPKSNSSGWGFSLLPRSLQKNPVLEFTVMTEVSDVGKGLPPVSPERPVYYVPFPGGAHEFGDAYLGETMLKAEDVERLLVRALAQNGYLPAQLPARPPALLVIYTWGTHNPASDGQVTSNFLDRAMLVGGKKFARQVRELMQPTSELEMTSSPIDLSIGTESAVEGDSTAAGGSAWQPPPVLPDWASALTNPISRFKLRDPKNEFLWDQTADTVYFVVASAYDYRAAAAHERKLLWRTRMTVSATGVSQSQSLPALIATAAPFFGKEMADPETISKRPVPEGKVKIGEPTVVEMPASSEPRKPVRKP